MHSIPPFDHHGTGQPITAAAAGAGGGGGLLLHQLRQPRYILALATAGEHGPDVTRIHHHLATPTPGVQFTYGTNVVQVGFQNIVVVVGRTPNQVRHKRTGIFHPAGAGIVTARGACQHGVPPMFKQTAAIPQQIMKPHTFATTRQRHHRTYKQGLKIDERLMEDWWKIDGRLMED
jgi:hypothetical protein